MEKITLQNAVQMSKEATEHYKLFPPDIKIIAHSSAAWEVFYRYCKENGMRNGSETGLSPIENVIAFVGELMEKANPEYIQKTRETFYAAGHKEGYEEASNQF